MSPASFSGAAHDRLGRMRADPAWLQQQCRDPLNQLVVFVEDRPLFAVDAQGNLQLAVTSIAAHAGESVLIGNRQGALVFAAQIAAESALAQETRAIDLRSLALQALVPDDQLGLLAQARSLLAWHARNSFCANCGSRTAMADAGYRRHCQGCDMSHFPRTDPVAIMVVTEGDRMLLGRQRHFQPGMYSALAGFIEPGETIEDGARREILEESGIRVGAVRYLASQPWPFPSSLMIGLIGEALSTTIEMDSDELEDVRWFDREEILLMLDGRHPQGLIVPQPIAIAHHLLRAVLQD